MRTDTLKNILIIILSVVVLGQAAWLMGRGSGPASSEARTLKRAAIVSHNTLEVEFSSPVDADAVPAGEAASLSPETNGTWKWSNPYQLRFVADKSFAPGEMYTLKLSQDLEIEGERSIELYSDSFELNTVRLSETRGTRPGNAVVKVVLDFNGPVAPEDLLENSRLVDETEGTEVPLSASTSWSDRHMILVSEPVKKDFEPRTYRFTLGKELKKAGTEQVLGQESSSVITLLTDPHFTFKGVDARSSASTGNIELRFSTPMDPDTASPFIRVEPGLDFSLSADGRNLVLSGGFMPGTKYKLALAKDMPAPDGSTLAKEESLTVAMPDVPASADFVGTGMFLPSGKQAGLVVEAVNTKRATLRVGRVYPNNLFMMLQEYGWRIFDSDYYGGVPSSVGSHLLEKELHFKGKRNQAVRLPVELGKLIPSRDRGLYRVGLSVPGQDDAVRWLLATDIGLVAKQGKEGILVWAVSNKTLQPLSNVRVTLVSSNNQRLSRVTTGKAGFVKLQVPSDHKHGSPFMILAETGDGDFSFLLPSRFGVDTTGLDVSGLESSPSGLRAYLYAERDLYRPGEILKGMAVIRKDDNQAPPSMPLVLQQTDPKGRVIRKVRLKTDRNGTADFAIPIPDYALTGMHHFVLLAGNRTIGSYDVKVEEFIPDRIKVEVKTDRESFAPGESIGVEISSSYLFGPPSADLPVTTSAVLNSVPFAAKGFEGYVFGNEEVEFQSQQFFSEEGRLDGDGNGNFTIPVPGGLKPPAALEAVIYGRVSETGGRGVTARKGVVVHPYAQYIGIRKLDRHGYDPGKEMTFAFVTTDPSGQAAPHGKLQATLYKDRWRSVTRRTPSGEYRYESVNDPKLVSRVTVDAGEAQGEVKFTPAQYGSYRMVLASADTGASTSVSFYCGGWGYSPWAQENPARIELALDRDQYDPGDVAVVQVRAPFAGRLLVAVEGDTVHDTQVVDLQGNTGEVRLPVKPGYAPNVYVTALLMRKASDVPEGSVGRAFGAVPLLVDNLSNKMKLSLEGPEQVRPEEELSIELKAEPGATVTIAAVDEGILQLSGSDDPDPFSYFYARRALGVRSFDTFAMLFPDMARVLGQAEAGGGMAMRAESQFMRTEGIRRVKPVSFWSGPMKADEDGTVRYSMQLPDFQGALRLVAVGLDGKRFGTARSMVRVRSPLAVTPTLPRFLASGDEIRMPVTVRNDMGKTAPVMVKVTLEGEVEGAGEPVMLEIENGREQTVHVPVKARDGAGGAAKITVLATSGQESRRVVTELPVRPAVPLRRHMDFGSLEREGGQLLSGAEGFVPGTAQRSVTLGKLPLARFSGKLEWLLRYPYGCAEQTTSKAFPLIRFNSLAKAYAPQLFENTSAANMVQAAIMRLGTMQTDNGGFSFWSGDDRPTPYVSAYVTHFLLEASQAGFPAPGMLDNALYYMEEFSRERSSDHLATCYALFNLAKAGRPQRGTMDMLRDNKKKQLNHTARTLLACAYAFAGDMDSYNGLLADLPPVKDGRESGGGLGSGLRDASLMLLALADARPDDELIPRLSNTVSRLMEVRSWGTTQENGLAFAALGKVFADVETGPFSGKLTAGEQSYQFADVENFARDGIDASKPLELALESGNGTVYWSVTTRGVPVPESVKPLSEGLEVRRSFLDSKGAPIDAASILQGELLIMKTEIRATRSAVKNVVIQALLPAGLEVENARLATTEVSAFKDEDERPIQGHQDLRDDRILFFTDLRQNTWHAGYTQLRAVTPGEYALPPVQAEAMYDPSIVASDEPARMTVTRKE